MIDRTSAFRAFVVGVVAGASMGIALGCATARASSGCEEEFVSLHDPVVIVIEGPGDVTAEQERWRYREVYWQGELQVPPVVVLLEPVDQ